MKTRKSLHPICLAVLLLCLLGVPVCAGNSKSRTAAPEGWPEQLGKWKLYVGQYGFVYTGSKSSVASMNKIVRTVVKELDQENVKMAGKGLILVMGKKEKPPFEVEKLLTMVARKESEKKKGQDAQKDQESLEESKKQMKELGLDINLILSITPLPIEPNMLPDLIRGFPKEVDRQIDWCMVIPTESNIKYGMKKMLDAGLKKEKIGIAKRVALFPILAIAERKAVGELKKARQLVLYQYFLDQQDHLTEQQKEAMKKAYEDRL
jgi:hypothetical protein